MTEELAPVYACRPVYWEEMYAAHDIPMPEEADKLDEIFQIYAYSVLGHCGTCNVQLWIGPRVQARQRSNPGPILCFLCGMTQEGVSTLGHLGNTHDKGSS